MNDKAIMAQIKVIKNIPFDQYEFYLKQLPNPDEEIIYSPNMNATVINKMPQNIH
jgi:hypothetical protein